MDEADVVPNPMVMGNNNRNQSLLSDLVINENENFLSEQFREDDMKAAVKQTRAIIMMTVKAFLQINAKMLT